MSTSGAAADEELGPKPTDSTKVLRKLTEKCQRNELLPEPIVIWGTGDGEGRPCRQKGKG